LIDDPPLDATYYLIKRMDKYENERGSLYSPGETAAWWVFAAVFTTLALLAALAGVSQFWKSVIMLHPFFIAMFFFFTAMCVSKSISFSSVVNRYLV